MRRCSCFLFFSFFDSSLVANVVAGATEDAFALVDFIRDTDIDAAFGAEQGTSAAGNTAVRNKEVLFFLVHDWKTSGFELVVCVLGNAGYSFIASDGNQITWQQN